MGAIAGARSLDCGRNSHLSARLDEGPHVLDPCSLVEIDGEKPAGLIRKERVDSHYMSARQMADYGRVAEGDERLIRALATLDPRQFTDAPYELVLARRGVSALSGFCTFETDI